MQIVYLANSRFPNEKANGLQIAKTLEALSTTGIKVQALFPKRKNLLRMSPLDYYSLKQLPLIEYLPVIDLLNIPSLGIIPHYLATLTFSFSVVNYLKKTSNTAKIYTRDWPLGFWIALFYPNRKLFIEVHQLPETKVGLTLFRFTLNRSDHIISTNPILTQEIKQRTTTPISTIPNGVDPSDYSLKPQRYFKKLLNLDPKKAYLVYTGSLSAWKGVGTLVQSSAFLSDNFHIFLVGGTSREAQQLLKKIDKLHALKITHIPHQSRKKLVQYQQAADILVIPNSATKSFSEKYSAPIKLFEYFFSNRPILASRVPSIVQFAQDQVAYFKPDNEKDLAHTAQNMLKNKKVIQTQLSNIKKRRYQFTWHNRAHNIINILKHEPLE